MRDSGVYPGIKRTERQRRANQVAQTWEKQGSWEESVGEMLLFKQIAADEELGFMRGKRERKVYSLV